jgi:glycosyltransferase involved in cell wall biosynthesis
MRCAVQSIVDQTYAGPIEIVVVFDACDPELPDVDLPGNRTLRALVNNRSRGLAGTRNTGILDATHEYVAFLDDDDSWLPAKLAAQMPVFDEHRDVLLVGTAMQVDDGRSLRDRLVAHSVVGVDDLVRDRLAGLHSSSFVFRRSALVESVGLIDEELPGSYGEDYDVLLRTARLAPIRVVDRPLIIARWQGQSYFFGKWAQYAESLEYLLSVHPEFQQDRAALARIGSQIAFAQAASGRRKDARSWAFRSLLRRPLNLRGWLALLISVRLISADAIGRLANRFGKGI